jgi:uncharacterized repeat protein (TIGR01451 family)
MAVCAALLPVAAPALPSPEAAIGGTVVNQARVEYVQDPGESAPPGTFRVESNAVHTPVLRPAEFDPLLLAVEPSGTVAPGTLLLYTVRASNRSGMDFTDVTFRLPLDLELEDPIAIEGEVSAAGAPLPPVAPSFDPATRAAVWTVPSIPDGGAVDLRARVRVRSDAPADSVAEAEASAVEGGLPDVVVSNRVSTPIVPPLLSVAKTADRGAAAPGDAVVFTLTVRHTATAPPLTGVVLVDRLPGAFRFVPGSLRVDGIVRPDPEASPDGSTLRIPLGPLEPGGVRVVSLATRVAAGAREEDVVNRAHAEGVTPGGAAIVSPDATAAVRVVPGPFRQEGHLVGRVFLDDDGNGLPGESEPGVPGVFVSLEDGRGAVTDVTGRWSLLGVRPGLHVLRLDPATLSETLTPVPAGAEWASNRSTRFVELRATTLAITDFPVRGDSVTRCEFRSGERSLRIATGHPPDAEDPRTAGWIDSAAAHLANLGASGSDPVTARCSGPDARPGRDEALARTLDGRIAARSRSAEAATRPPVRPSAAAPAGASAFEDLVRTSPPVAAIVHPADGARAERESTHVDVTYPAGSEPELRVNGLPVDPRTIGTTSTLPSRGISASRYVGVRLVPGRNRLDFRAIPAGADRDAIEGVTAFVSLPGPPVGLRLEVAESGWTSDGVTPGTFVVEAVDGAGSRVSESLLITVVVEGGAFSEPDLDPQLEGIQVRLAHGSARLSAGPWVSPGRVHLRAWTPDLEVEADVPVLPATAARWRIFGLAEGRVAGEGGVEGDGGLPPGLVDDVTSDGGRIAFSARGPVAGASTLTVSVDTDRDRDPNRLFGDFEPDRFYPTAGDSSVEVFGADRQGPVYARVDGPWGFALYGDFATGFDRTELARYDRRLPGAAARAMRGPVVFEAFAASTDQRVTRDLFEPDGTSGPYLLSTRPVVARSESVVIETRDRIRTDEVIARRVLRPDLDYALDPEAGTILFRGPVAPFDRDLQPVRVVVVYEVRDDGEDLGAGGVRVAYRRGERVEAGVSAVREQRDGEDFGLYGADLVWRPGPGTHVRGEVATSDDGGVGATAVAFEASSRLRGGLTLEAAYRDIPAEFSNPTLLAAPEIGGRRALASALWEPAGPWRARGEITWQDDEIHRVERLLASAEAERRFQRASLLAAIRRVHSAIDRIEEDATVLEAGIRGRLTNRLTAEASHRQSLGDPASGYPDRTVAGVGFEIAPGQRLFVRQEWESGDGPDRDRTVAGVETALTANTKALAQYALEGGLPGASARASAGIETTIPLDAETSVQFRIARLQTTRGDEANDFTTLGGGWERRSGEAVMSARYELYLGSIETRHLGTASGAFRVSEPWTLFVRERVFLSDAAAGPRATRAEGLFGTAYRPLGGAWQFLARFDHALGGGSAAGPGGVAPGSTASEPFGSVAVVPRSQVPPGVGFSDPRLGLASLRDSFSLHLAAGVRAGARQRVAGSWIVRHVGADSQAGLDASLTDLLSLHYTVEVHPRWTVGASARRFAQHETGTTSYGAGLEFGHLAWKDFWILTGYNLKGFRDDAFPTRDRTDEGAFLAVRFKFDEGSLADLGDLRLDRP